MNCVITGCFVEDQTGRWSICDLYEIGNCYVMRCVTDNTNQTLWWSRHAEKSHLRGVLINSPEYFERDGVLVHPRQSCHLNDEAKKYLGIA